MIFPSLVLTSLLLFSIPPLLPLTGALVAAICFGVLFLSAGVILVGKRWYEGYQRRHYNKMDYLINGMYN